MALSEEQKTKYRHMLRRLIDGGWMPSPKNPTTLMYPNNGKYCLFVCTARHWHVAKAVRADNDNQVIEAIDVMLGNVNCPDPLAIYDALIRQINAWECVN